MRWLDKAHRGEYLLVDDDGRILYRVKELLGEYGLERDWYTDLVSAKRAAEQRAARGFWWVVVDDAGHPLYIVTHPEAAHEHVNDAINEHEILEAARWVVRKVRVVA